MATARANDALNGLKDGRRLVLWVAEPSAQNILATGDVAKGVPLEHLSVDEANALVAGFQGSASVRNVCIVLYNQDSALLVRDSHPHRSPLARRTLSRSAIASCDLMRTSP